MIRPLLDSDAEAIALIARHARSEAITGFPDLHTVDEDIAYYRSQIDASSGFAFTDEFGHILGFVMGAGHMINHLYVGLEVQRLGIGSALLSRISDALVERPMQLWTFQSNVKAVTFYRKHGFVVVGQTDGAGNDEGLPDYLFERA